MEESSAGCSFEITDWNFKINFHKDKMHLNFRISLRALLLGVREEFFRPTFMPLNFVTNVLAFVSNVCLKMFRNGILLFHNCTAKRTCFLYYISQLYIHKHVIDLIFICSDRFFQQGTRLLINSISGGTEIGHTPWRLSRRCASRNLTNQSALFV